MMAQLGSEQEEFHSLLDHQRTQSYLSDELKQIRDAAWEHYLSLGLPTKQNEAYRYIKLRHLFSQSHSLASDCELDRDQIEALIYPECKESVLVFVNGYYNSRLSCVDALPSKVVVSSLQDSMKTFGVFLRNTWSKSLKEERDPFATLNSALHPRGTFVYVPPKCIVEVPLQILQISATTEPFQVTMPRVLVFAGAHSQVEIISVQKNIGAGGCFINQTTEVALEEGAHVHYSQVLCDEHPQGWHFDAFRATLKKNSSLTTVCATQGSMAVRNDCKIVLAGENAEALLNGVWMLDERKEAHVNVLIDHQAPYCRSHQLFKGVLSDFSRSSFEGKIMVRQAAQKTEAFQLNNNLLLSDHAHAYSKPNLEIFADDVKASHGATVGQLDPEQLFYMKTRGVSEQRAKNLLTSGFCEQVVEKFQLETLSKEVSYKINQCCLKKEHA
jgi:Fe-S cluster assembly protein SufD